MQKWLGRSGALILVKETKKIGIRNLDDLSEEQKAKLLEVISKDCLSTFLSHSRYLVAKSQLVDILDIDINSHLVNKDEYRKARNPSLIGKPRTSERMEED